jgi:hypothetical protein
MMAFLLNGKKYDKNVGDFALWVAEYVFNNQMQLFGDSFELVAAKQIVANERRGRVVSLLAELPNKFTRAELMALRARRGQSTHVAMVISRWREAGLVNQTAQNTYEKTPKAIQMCLK